MINEIHFLNEGLFSSLFKKKDTKEDKEIRHLKYNIALISIYLDITNKYENIVNQLSNSSISEIDIQDIKKVMDDTYNKYHELIDFIQNRNNENERKIPNNIEIYSNNEYNLEKLKEMRYSILNKIEHFTDKIEKVFYNFMNLKIIDIKKINNKYYLKRINNNAKNVLKLNNKEFEIFTDFVRNQYHHNNCISLEEIYNFALEGNRDFYTKYDQDIID